MAEKILILLDFFIFFCSKLRKRKSNLIICILCISVAAGNILNFAVQRSADLPIPCKVVAALTHFFLLSKIVWMTILAFHLYFELIKVYSTVNLLTTSRLITITTLIGFGMSTICYYHHLTIDDDFNNRIIGILASYSHD